MNSILIKERLIEQRQTMGITKQEAAKRMNMSQPAYLRYESGARIPSIHVVQTMANVLETSAEYLTGQSDNPNPNSYLIHNDTDPELFELITEYRESTADDKKRLLEYCKLLKTKNV